MRRTAAVLLAAPLLLSFLPSCLPIGGCGGGDGVYNLHVRGSVDLTLADPEVDGKCDAGARTAYHLNVDDTGAINTMDRRQPIQYLDGSIESQNEASADATWHFVDGDADVTLDLVFDSDGTVLGLSTAHVGACTVTHTVSGSFAPEFG